MGFGGGGVVGSSRGVKPIIILTESTTTCPVVSDPRKKLVGNASGFDGVTPDAAPKNRCWPGRFLLCSESDPVES